MPVLDSSKISDIQGREGGRKWMEEGKTRKGGAGGEGRWRLEEKRQTNLYFVSIHRHADGLFERGDSDRLLRRFEGGCRYLEFVINFKSE